MALPRLLRNIAGTSSVGVFTLATLSVGIGAGYLGYHKSTTGNAIKRLVPEWQVDPVEQLYASAVPVAQASDPLCASEADGWRCYDNWSNMCTRRDGDEWVVRGECAGETYEVRVQPIRGLPRDSGRRLIERKRAEDATIYTNNRFADQVRDDHGGDAAAFLEAEARRMGYHGSCWQHLSALSAYVRTDGVITPDQWIAADPLIGTAGNGPAIQPTGATPGSALSSIALGHDTDWSLGRFLDTGPLADELSPRRGAPAEYDESLGLAGLGGTTCRPGDTRSVRRSGRRVRVPRCDWYQYSPTAVGGPYSRPFRDHPHWDVETFECRNNRTAASDPASPHTAGGPAVVASSSPTTEVLVASASPTLPPGALGDASGGSPVLYAADPATAGGSSLPGAPTGDGTLVAQDYCGLKPCNWGDDVNPDDPLGLGEKLPNPSGDDIKRCYLLGVAISCALLPNVKGPDVGDIPRGVGKGEKERNEREEQVETNRRRDRQNDGEKGPFDDEEPRTAPPIPKPSGGGFRWPKIPFPRIPGGQRI